MKENKRLCFKVPVILVGSCFIIAYLYLVFCCKTISCYKLRLTNTKEIIYSPDIYINGSLWLEDNCLLYRPFRSAGYICLKDSVKQFEKIKCN